MKIIECIELGVGMGLVFLIMYVTTVTGHLLIVVMCECAKNLVRKLKNRTKKGTSK